MLPLPASHTDDIVHPLQVFQRGAQQPVVQRAFDRVPILVDKMAQDIPDRSLEGQQQEIFRAVLNGHYLDVLITDEETATVLLHPHDQT